MPADFERLYLPPKLKPWKSRRWQKTRERLAPTMSIPSSLQGLNSNESPPALTMKLPVFGFCNECERPAYHSNDWAQAGSVTNMMKRQNLRIVFSFAATYGAAHPKDVRPS